MAETTQGRNDSAPTIICEPGLCSVSRSINFYKTSHRMMVLLLAGVRTKKEKQPRNFRLNVKVVYRKICFIRRYIDAIKLTTVLYFFGFKCISFWKTQFCSFWQKIVSLYLDRFDSLNGWRYQLAFIYHLGKKVYIGDYGNPSETQYSVLTIR